VCFYRLDVCILKINGECGRNNMVRTLDLGNIQFPHSPVLFLGCTSQISRKHAELVSFGQSLDLYATIHITGSRPSSQHMSHPLDAVSSANDEINNSRSSLIHFLHDINNNNISKKKKKAVLVNARCTLHESTRLLLRQ